MRHRVAIDFPMLNVAVCVALDHGGAVERLGVAISALAARPVVLDTARFVGRALDPALLEEVATLAHTRCVPLTNICDDPLWRREMVPVLVRRAWNDAVRAPPPAV